MAILTLYTFHLIKSKWIRRKFVWSCWEKSKILLRRSTSCYLFIQLYTYVYVYRFQHYNTICLSTYWQAFVADFFSFVCVFQETSLNKRDLLRIECVHYYYELWIICLRARNKNEMFKSSMFHQVESMRNIFLAQWLIFDSRQQKDETASTQSEECDVDSKESQPNISVFKCIFIMLQVGQWLLSIGYRTRVRHATCDPKTP